MYGQKYKANDPLGSDFRHAFDMDPELSQCSGREVLINDVLKRLSTPKGALFWAPNEGLSLDEYANSPLDQTAAELARDIELELSKDERIAGSEVNVSLDTTKEQLDIFITVEASDGETFDIVGNINAGYTPTFERAA